MKRLQFRHNNTIWESRANAKTFLENIVNSGSVESIAFEGGLYAEPLITRYLDEDGNLQVIFAIGVDSGYTKYHTIDSKEIAELIDNNKKAIEAEVERAKDAEKSLSGSIETEIARAMEAELFLSGTVNTEHDERVAADVVLQTQITENIAKIVPVTENLGANVREEYVLKNAKGEELGSHIKVYKDSALVGAEVNYKGATAVSQKEDGTFEFTYGADMDKEVEYLYLIYRNENGGLSLVALDFENFLMENEEGLGIKIVDHKITIKIKDGEKYLTTTEDGLQTIDIDKAIKESVDTLFDNLTTKIDAEIERSTNADDYISGLTAEFSAATVAELTKTNSAVTEETERAIAAELYLSGAVETETARALEAELFLSGAVDTERTERIAEDDAIKAEIKSNKINSKDIVVNKTAEGTSLTIQTDEVTLTKFASASTIYDTNVAVLGTLLRVKKVEPTASNVKSRYELQGADGQLIGDPIEMSIESALVDVKQGKVGDVIDPSNGNYITFGEGDTTMNFVYRLEDGSYELVQVVVSEYFTDSHFGRGLNNQDGTVSLLEGDGNEYLVIGEDTIAVVGVNNAIANAKTESETLINEKYESATGYTDQRYNESIAHTDTRVDDVVSSVDSLTNTIDTAIDGLNDTLTAATTSMNETVNNAVDGMKATVNSAVEGFNTLLTEAINGVNYSLGVEISNREKADNVLDSKISGNTTAISTLQSDHIAFSGSIISYVDNKVNGKFDEIGAAASAETKAREYADTLNAAMSERVVALEEDIHIHANKVELDKIAEGDKEKWDGAVARLDNFLVGNGVDEVIDTLQDIKDWMKGEGVVATELTEAIAAEARLRGDADANEANLREAADNALGVRITALEGINHDAYKEADNTLRNEISILSGNTFNALTVEREYINAASGNIETTLITKTDALNNTLSVVSSNVDVISGSVNNINLSIKELSGSVVNTVTAHTADINRLSGDVASYVNAITSGISYNVNLLSGNTFAAITALTESTSKGFADLSGNVLTYVNNEDAKIVSAITKNEVAIAVLNADKKTEGSVLYRIENEFEKSLITNGVPVTAVSPEEANKVHSLIRQITVNGEMRYYAISDATEMFYVKPRATEAAPIETVNLNDYITSLERRVAVLEESLTGFAGNMEQTMKDLIKSYLNGTQNEIKITETDDKLTIGFDDNAIFGEI